ncbi:hypothetical protein CMV_012781 [Castanea mollissima]|uniref:Uncharacterized protein n=1 Tax=Castanea mollissima TaxID=60419 RepID=A0A8J4RGH9_9ROSI|nr:hypothetical protein CMV_012781 [Castanea mollissima]
MDSPSSCEAQGSANANQPEETKISCMDLDVYNGATAGKIEVFKNSSPPLHLQELLTPNGNTVLHVYLTALSKRLESSTANFVEEILKMCRLLPRLESSTANFVEEILRMCPSLLSQANAKGEIPLHIAARHGHVTMVEVLINFADSRPQDVENGERNAKKMLQITNKEKETALHEAIRYNHLEVVKLLLEVDPNYSYSANDVGETPLYMAVERNFQELAFEILNTCKSPAYDGPLQRTVLHAAVICDNREMTQKILEKVEARRALAKQADQQAYIKDKNGKTALHIAAHRGNGAAIQEILSRCPDCFELVDNEGRNVLHIAVATSMPWPGPRDTVNFFLTFRKFSNLFNEKDDDGNTPLHLHSNALWLQRSLMRHPKVDQMAFNKQNLNAYDLALTSDKLPSAKGESLVIFPFSYTLFVLFPALYSVIFLFGHPMPLRKKNTSAQAGLGENQQAEASVDYVFMHIEGTESFEEVGQLDNRDLAVAIKDLQCSEATMWEEF